MTCHWNLRLTRALSGHCCSWVGIDEENQKTNGFLDARTTAHFLPETGREVDERSEISGRKFVHRQKKKKKITETGVSDSNRKPFALATVDITMTINGTYVPIIPVYDFRAYNDT